IKESVRRMKGLSPEQRHVAEDFLMEYRELFRHSLEDAGAANMEPMPIEVLVDRPVRAATRPLAPKEEKAAHEEVDKLLASGAISPSRSPWNAPIIIVPKKDGGLR